MCRVALRSLYPAAVFTPVTDGCHSSPLLHMHVKAFTHKVQAVPPAVQTGGGNLIWGVNGGLGWSDAVHWLDASKELLNKDLLKQNGRGAADTHTSGDWVRNPVLLPLVLALWTFYFISWAVSSILKCAYLSCKHGFLPRLLTRAGNVQGIVQW